MTDDPHASRRTGFEKVVRPGIALAWSGVVCGLLGLVLTNARFAGSAAGWVLFGVYGPLVDMALIVCGIGLGILAIILSGWALVVSLVHASNIHLLCAAGCLLGAIALVAGHHAYLGCLPVYEAMQQQG